MDMSKLEKLDSSCFHGAYCDICKIIGQEATILLHEHYSGQLVSLPKKLLSDHYVHDEICREYDGTNSLALAKKFGFTVSWIRKVVKTKMAELAESKTV